MRCLLLVAISIPLIISGLFFAPYSSAQIQILPPSDFSAAVRAGLQSLKLNPAAQSQQLEIKNQDYKSTWDEFGISVLIDGNTSPAEVDNQITQDIVQAVETAQNYNQQEANYLQETRLAPEQVQAAESSAGTDILPSQSINPNPSIDANPDVNISPADIPMQDDTENSVSSSNANNVENVNISASTSTNEVVETSTTATSGLAPASTSIPAPIVTTDINVPITDISTSSDENTIYNAILQGEQTQSVNQTTPAADNDGNQSPPPADNTPPAP